MECSTEKQLTLIADSKVVAIPIIDNGDIFIDLKDQNLLIYGPSPEIPNNTDYTKMRKAVYEKLLQAQDLLPEGIRFCLYEGYRSLSLQKILFDTRYEIIRKHNINWSKNQIFEETINLVSPVINLDGSANIPPHSTGGAVDLYLIDNMGNPLEMGIHPEDWMQDESGSISLTHSAIISTEAKHHRRIMNRVLETVGLVNYPTEYWHWSYGDRYWAYQLGRPHALYGGMR